MKMFHRPNWLLPIVIGLYCARIDSVVFVVRLGTGCWGFDSKNSKLAPSWMRRIAAADIYRYEHHSLAWNKNHLKGYYLFQIIDGNAKTDVSNRREPGMFCGESEQAQTFISETSYVKIVFYAENYTDQVMSGDCGWPALYSHGRPMTLGDWAPSNILFLCFVVA